MSAGADFELFRVNLLKKIKEEGLSFRAVSLGAGLNEKFVAQIMSGKSRYPRYDNIAKLAAFLQCDPSDLTGASASKPTALSQTAELVGTIRAGYFREALEEPEFDRERIIIAHSTRYPGVPRFALRVDGLSMNEKLPDGSYAICVRYADMGAVPQSGDLVICQRAGPGGTIEATCKEFVIEADGSAYLWPRSTHPDFQRPYKLVPPGEAPDIADDWGDLFGAVQARQIGADEVDDFEIVAKVITYQMDYL